MPQIEKIDADKSEVHIYLHDLEDSTVDDIGIYLGVNLWDLIPDEQPIATLTVTKRVRITGFPDDPVE
jgi:hypothetical protein